MPPSKDEFLERKIMCLEKRLTLVERFMELRFCESIRDFSIRNVDDHDSPPTSGTSKRKKISKARCTPEPSPPPPAVKKIPGRRGRPPKAIKAVEARDHSPSASDRSTPRKALKNSVQNRPGPSSVKRKALEKADADAAKVGKRGDENMEDCVVRVVRCSAGEDVGRSRDPVSSTPVSGRGRRTPIFKQEIIEDYTRKPRYNTRRKRRGAPEEEDDDDDDDTSAVLENDKVPDSESQEDAAADDHIEEILPSDHEDNNNDGVEEEEEESYFTFPTKSTIRVRNNAAVNLRGDDDELGVDAVDPSDGNWSGVEDNQSYEDGEEEEYAEVEQKPKYKKAKVPRKSSTTPGAKRGRKRLEDSDFPRKRTYISAKFEALPTDAIAGNDPSKKECPVCHKHFKNEMIVNHMEGHMKERHLKCPECDKTYFNQAMLRKHMRVHQPEKYGKKCRLCEKLFYQSDKVLAHERFCVKKALEKNEPVDPTIVEDLKRRSSAGWIDETLLTQKVAEGDSSRGETERKQCPHCKKFFRSDIYNRHVKTHETTRNWACNLCEKAYFHKHDLVRHVATEHVQNPSCEICQKSFKDRASLKLHLTACRREQRKSIKIKSVTSLHNAQEEEEEAEEVRVKDELFLDSNSRGAEIGTTTMEISQRTESVEQVSTELTAEGGQEIIDDQTNTNHPGNSREIHIAPQEASLVLVNPHTGVEEQTVTFVLEDIGAPEVVAEEEIVSS